MTEILRIEHEKLMEDWRCLGERNGQSRTEFLSDGAIDIDRWLVSSRRIMFLLKEGYREPPDTWTDVSECLRIEMNKDGKPYGPAFKYLAKWACTLRTGIALGAVKWADTRGPFLESAVVNVKKFNTKSRKSDSTDILNYGLRDGHLVRRQVEILSPHLLVFCGTFDAVGDSFAPLEPLGQLSSGRKLFLSANTTLLAYRHPTYSSFEDVTADFRELRSRLCWADSTS